MFGKIFLNHPVGMENKYVHDCVCLIYIDIYIFCIMCINIYIHSILTCVFIYTYKC